MASKQRTVEIWKCLFVWLIHISILDFYRKRNKEGVGWSRPMEKERSLCTSASLVQIREPTKECEAFGAVTGVIKRDFDRLASSSAVQGPWEQNEQS